MPTHEIASGRYMSPTPGGAYLAVAGPQDDPARRLLLALLEGDTTPLLTRESAAAWSGVEDAEAALAHLLRLQAMALVQSETSPRHAPAGALEQLLPTLLQRLSSTGRALLADTQGFYIAATGFPHETAEELSALSADLASLHRRHARLLANNLGIADGTWALVDPAGNSRLGVWPLCVGDERFALVLGGTPRLNQAPFVDLVWALTRRYAAVGPREPARRARVTAKG